MFLVSGFCTEIFPYQWSYKVSRNVSRYFSSIAYDTKFCRVFSLLHCKDHSKSQNDNFFVPLFRYL